MGKKGHPFSVRHTLPSDTELKEEVQVPPEKGRAWPGGRELGRANEIGMETSSGA